MRPRPLWVALFVLSTGSLLFAAGNEERKLDAPLKLLYRAQAGGGAAAGQAPFDAQRASELLERLRGIRDKASGATPAVPSQQLRSPRLTLLVKHMGHPDRLQEVGFRVQARVGNIYTGTLDAAGLGDLARVPEVQLIQLSQELRASVTPRSSLSRASLLPMASPSFALQSVGGSIVPQGVSASGVIVAFVDTGVDIFHEDFRTTGGATRIKYLLDLSDPGDIDDDGDLDGTGPLGGTLYTEADISAALTSSGTVNQRDTTGHGTHGLSIAAGDDPTFLGLAPAADLIVVKATREDGTLSFTSADVVSALAFIDQKAAELGKPYVVNLSLGTLFSSHDGRSLEEQVIDAIFGPGIPGGRRPLAARSFPREGRRACHNPVADSDGKREDEGR